MSQPTTPVTVTLTEASAFATLTALYADRKATVHALAMTTYGDPHRERLLLKVEAIRTAIAALDTAIDAPFHRTCNGHRPGEVCR